MASTPYAHNQGFRPFTPKGAELDYKLGATSNDFGTFARGGYESPPAQPVIFPALSFGPFCFAYPYDPRNLSLFDSSVIGGFYNTPQTWTVECAAGNTYTVTVPAFTTFSTKSQNDADIQARALAIQTAAAQCQGDIIINCDDLNSQSAYYYDRNSPVLTFNAQTTPTPTPPNTNVYLAPYCLRQFDYCYINGVWSINAIYRVRSNANGGKQILDSFFYTFSDSELEQIAAALNVTLSSAPFRMIFTAQMYRWNNVPERTTVSSDVADSEGRVIEVKILN